MTIPPDFTDIDPDENHWVMTPVAGPTTRFPDPDLWCVPSINEDGDMTDAMMSEIPGQDDTVTPRKHTETRFYKFCMAFLMQDGNLGVPGGRYGRDTRDCAEIAIIMSLVMRYHNGEPVSYYSLNSDMSSVVNSSDGVTSLISESQYIFDDEEFGVNVKEILGDEYEPQTALEQIAKFCDVEIDTNEGDSSGTLSITMDDDDAEKLIDAIQNSEPPFGKGDQ